MPMDYDEFRANVVNNLLNLEGGTFTETGISNTVNLMVEVYEKQGSLKPGTVDPETLITDLSQHFITWRNYGDPEIFEGNNEEHEHWLNEEYIEQHEWKYWDRYKLNLSKGGLSQYAIDNIDTVTKDVLSRLENPHRHGAWDRRGMVVGYVQSGKTANYTGLICKATDAGYRLIIVLAGLHNNLRSQTQKRIDDGFLGYKTSSGNRIPIGVGQISSKLKSLNNIDHPQRINCLTSGAEDGDFKTASNNISMFAQTPVCLVVKKNSSILENVLLWANSLSEDNSGEGKVTDVPLLLIDDEADNASLNTKKYLTPEEQKEQDISTINRLIRQILVKFQKSAYVGYTATPYANVFVDPQARSDAAGADLFPRNFIITMPEPPGYFGPSQVFGHEPEGDVINTFAGIENVSLEDQNILIPLEERKNPLYQPKELPPSLKEAIKSFILACAVREERNQKGKKRIDNSMLIHVTRYTKTQGLPIGIGRDVQSGILKLVNMEIDVLKKLLGIGDKETLDEFKTLWTEKFAPKSAQIRAIIPDKLCTEISWDTVKLRLADITMRKIKIKVINGQAKDSLDYSEHPEGLYVIAIGGDKLSRGLTLEGLTTSYFLRTAGTYDTLYQMGRWFGFRPGYVDLCRVYTTDDIVQKFRVVNIADKNLRDQFIRMDAVSRTPENYNLKIIQTDSRFRITQQNKMRAGRKKQENPYSGNLQQTYKFKVSQDVINTNFSVIDNFIIALNDLHKPEKVNGNYIWKSIPSDIILDHMPHYVPHPEQQELGIPLYEYINTQKNQGIPELTNWTIVLINKSSESERREIIGGLPVNLTMRNPSKDPITNTIPDPEILGEYSYSKNNILNDASEEGLDLSQREIYLASDRMRDDYNAGINKKHIRNEPVYGKPSGYYIRMVRPVTDGLLLIYPITWKNRSQEKKPVFGIAYSFPLSNTALSTEYIANAIGQEDENDL